MMKDSNVKFTIALNNPDLDAEELEQLTRNLLREMKDLDEVQQVGLVAAEEIPQGSKAFGGFLLGILQAEVSVANIKALMGFLGDRLGGQPIEMEVEANGKKLKVKASSRQELVTAIEAAQQFVTSA